MGLYLCLSVSVRVCPSVTSRCSIARPCNVIDMLRHVKNRRTIIIIIITKTAKRRITETTPHDSSETLVFWAKDLREILPGSPPTGAPNTGGVGQNRRLSTDNRLYLDKKLSYRRETARCAVTVEILPIATQQCRNYLYDKSWTKYQLSLIYPCDKIIL